jgi:hypothetical protein
MKFLQKLGLCQILGKKGFKIFPEIEPSPVHSFRSISLHGNPQRTVRSNIMQQGPDAVLRYLKEKIPYNCRESSSLSVLPSVIEGHKELSELDLVLNSIEQLEENLSQSMLVESKR